MTIYFQFFSTFCPYLSELTVRQYVISIERTVYAGVWEIFVETTKNWENWSPLWCISPFYCLQRHCCVFLSTNSPFSATNICLNIVSRDIGGDVTWGHVTWPRETCDVWRERLFSSTSRGRGWRRSISGRRRRHFDAESCLPLHVCLDTLGESLYPDTQSLYPDTRSLYPDPGGLLVWDNHIISNRVVLKSSRYRAGW